MLPLILALIYYKLRSTLQQARSASRLKKPTQQTPPTLSYPDVLITPCFSLLNFQFWLAILSFPGAVARRVWTVVCILRDVRLGLCPFVLSFAKKRWKSKWERYKILLIKTNFKSTWYFLTSVSASFKASAKVVFSACMNSCNSMLSASRSWCCCNRVFCAAKLFSKI